LKKYLTHFEPEMRLCGWNIRLRSAIAVRNCLIFGSHAPLTTERSNNQAVDKEHGADGKE
jgi:hypothetical protein